MDYFWFVADLWSVSQQLQKRILRFLLKRTLGPFLYQDLTLDQLDVTVGGPRREARRGRWRPNVADPLRSASPAPAAIARASSSAAAARGSP